MLKFFLYFIAICLIIGLIKAFPIPCLLILGCAVIVFGIVYLKRRNTSASIPDSDTASPVSSSSDISSGNYYLAYHYDSVKFYPPIEIVSKIDRTLLRSGAEVVLKPEPKNKHDSRAIALYVSKHQIGYLLRGTLQDMVHDYIAKEWPIKATLVSLKLVDGEYQGYIELSFYRESSTSTKRRGYSDIDIHSIHPSDPNAHPSTPLTGKNIVFSGYFTIPIDEMMQIAVDAGSILKSRVTKNTKYLVIGEQGQDFVDSNGMSSKEATAKRLIQQGEADIRIIGEKTFLELAQCTIQSPQND